MSVTQPVEGVGEKAALHQILVHRRRRRRTGSAVFAPVTDAGQAGVAHQPGDPLAPTRQAQPEPELGVHPWRSVGPAGGLVHRGDRRTQRRISHCSSARSAPAPLVVARAEHLQHAAGHRDIEAVDGELLDQPKP